MCNGIFFSVLDIGEADHFVGAFAHNGDAVGDATVVFIEDALGVATHGGVHAVIGGDKVVGRLEERGALFFVGGVGKAVGAFAHVDVFGAAAIAFVELTFFQSAFNVFHGFFSFFIWLRY